MEYVYTELATLLAVIITYGMSLNVGRKRSLVEAPATTGHPDFERAFRAHYNTIENLVIFLPVLWLAAPYAGDFKAGMLGLLWGLGRVVFALQYSKGSSRAIGMLLTSVAWVALAVYVILGLYTKMM